MQRLTFNKKKLPSICIIYLLLVSSHKALMGQGNSNWAGGKQIEKYDCESSSFTPEKELIFFIFFSVKNLVNLEQATESDKN